MGGKGSGATRDSWAKKKYEGVSRKSQTQATERFYDELTRQNGDSLFEVWRCYPSGKKACLGSTEDVRIEQLAIQFGGGEYELVQLDRGKMLPTGKPPLRRVLHPGKFPVLPQYAKDPIEVELDQARELARAGMMTVGAGQAARADLAGMAPEQILAKAKEEALREFQAQAKMDQLTTALATLTQQVQALATGGGGTGGNMQLLRDMLALSKELTPAPQPAGNLVPQNPAEVVRQAVEAIKTLQTEMNGLPGGNPMLRALKGSSEHNPNVGILANTLSQLAMAALPYLLGNGPAPAAPSGWPPAQPAAPAAAPQPATTATMPAPAPAPSAAPSDLEVQNMLSELGTKLSADQAQQLADSPAGHISETVAWIRQRWSHPAAGMAWANLRMAVRSYPEAQVLDFVGKQLPALADTEKKKAWLASLIDLLRKD